MELKLDQNYWSERYETGRLGWDIGYVSTPLKEYIDQLEDKTIKILVPGAGNSYEAEYLWNCGFMNTHVLDISSEPLENLKERVPEFPPGQLHCKDFFDFHGEFDLILEQTFFSALDPSLRKEYAIQMLSLLKPKGRLAGLLFNIPLFDDHPPFGGNKEAYQLLFQSHFEIEILEKAYNSIPERAGSEVFIKFRKA